MSQEPTMINLALETQQALEEIDIPISGVSRVEFYNHHERRMEQCTYDEFDRVAQTIVYPRSPDGENYRVIQPDLRICVEGGYLERATEEDGHDGWTSVGSAWAMVDRVVPTGTLLPIYLRYQH